jgi:hypothetical protein
MKKIALIIVLGLGFGASSFAAPKCNFPGYTNRLAKGDCMDVKDPEICKKSYFIRKFKENGKRQKLAIACYVNSKDGSCTNGSTCGQKIR